MYEQKEIILIPFPYSDLTGSKQRPALIISNKIINKTQDRICCLVTSNHSENTIPIEDTSISQGGLPFKSYVKPHRIFTVNSGIIKKKLCVVNNDFYDKILLEINKLLVRK